MKKVLLTSAAVFALTSVAAATGPGGDVLYDNGISFLNGLSHLTTPSRRSVLDDFTSGLWSITDFHLKFAWADGTTGTGTDLELVFYGDAGGQPDFNNVVHTATNRSYMEMRDPNNPNFFGLSVVDIWVTFDKFILNPGTYWVDMHVVGPVNGFQVIGNYPQSNGAPAWVDYADFGGRQPGFNVFGDDYDLNFVITGKEVPAPGAVALLGLAGLVGSRRRR
jgi:MYXO-CTERM domain-containing protein